MSAEPRRARVALLTATLAATFVSTFAVPGAAQSAAPHAPHAHPASPSPHGAAERAFLAAARAGTARYRDLATAVADGYRRIGGELPGMGEHWLHNRRALADTLDAAAPPILIYAHGPDGPMLAGAAYVRLLAAGEAYPAFPAASVHAWHEHNGRVDEEVLPLGHAPPAAPRPSDSTAPRIAVLHAWTWLANPAGPFAADNWALPYVRLGLRPDVGPGGADARALSLLADDGAYYRRAARTVGALDSAADARVGAVFAEHRARVAHLSRRLAAADAAGDARAAAPVTAALAAEWARLWDAVERVVGPAAGVRLAPLLAAVR